MNNLIFTEGTSPFTCNTQDEYDRVVQLMNDEMVSGRATTRKKAANIAITIIKDERKAALSVARQQTVASNVSMWQQINITCTPSGFPEQIARNYETLLSIPNYFDSLRTDDFTGQIFYGDSPMTDVDRSKIFATFSDITRCQMENRSKIDDAINVVADRNRFNQLTDYLDSLVWDGVSRAGTIFQDFLGVEDKTLYKKFGIKWMLGAVRRAYRPGCKFDSILVLTGPQGIGKSQFCKRMAIKTDWYTENVQIGDKDGYLQLSKSWIVNMDEIASLNKRDTATAKNFITKEEDTYRKPYGRFSETYKRHNIFIGTTNEDSFLKDSTAVSERRYWILRCNGTVKEMIERFKKLTPEYVDQVWAEILDFDRKHPDYPLYLSGEDIVEFNEDQLQYKSDFETDLFIFLDDILNREYVNFMDDNSLSNQYSNPVNNMPTVLQDKFTLSALNNLLRNNHVLNPKGAIRHYADMHPEEWKFCKIRVPYKNNIVWGLKRATDSNDKIF